jgi:hypothetical protein
MLSNNPSLLSYNTFVSSGTKHAIEITTPGSYVFSGNSFDGYATSNGTTGNEAIYNNSGGAVTLTITNGGDTPTIRNGAGATTTVNNNKVLTLTGIISGSDIVILTAGTSTELVNIDQNAGATYQYSYAYAANTYVDVGLFKTGYVPFFIRNYLLGSTDASLPVNQITDRNFQ